MLSGLTPGHHQTGLEPGPKASGRVTEAQTGMAPPRSLSRQSWCHTSAKQRYTESAVGAGLLLVCSQDHTQ